MCRVEYQRAELHTRTKTSDNWHVRDAHKTAFDEVCRFVTELVIGKDEGYLMIQLATHYRSVFIDIDHSSFKDVAFTSQDLEKKLRRYFEDKIKIDGGNKRRGNIIYSAAMDPYVAARKAYNSDKELNLKLRDAAFELRKVINTEKRRLPKTLNLTDIYEGEINLPQLSVEFLNCLSGSRQTSSTIRSKKKAGRFHFSRYCICGNKWFGETCKTSTNGNCYEKFDWKSKI